MGQSAEALEDKTLLTVYTVNTTLDQPANNSGVTDGLVSLREAINAANSNAAFGDAPAGSGGAIDVINFAGSMSGMVITLGGADLDITDDLTINGPGANLLTINGNNATRHFEILGSGVDVILSGLTLTGGNDTSSNGGGSIRNTGTSIVLVGMNFEGNRSSSFGGAIDDDANGVGSMLFVTTTFSNNISAVAGGAIDVASPAQFINSTISGNSAINGGGGIGISTGGEVTLVNSTVVLNRSNSNGSSKAGDGGGINAVGNQLIELRNTIVAGNIEGTGTTPDDIEGSVFIGSQNNLIGDANTAGGLSEGGFQNNIVGVNGSGTRDINTVLNTTLQNNGGTVPTHSLLETSIAVNAGNNSLARDQNSAFLTSDGRGAPFKRFGAGTGNADTTVDIGAFELQPLFEVNTLIDETNNNNTFSLREAIAAANAQNIGANIGGSTDEIQFEESLKGGSIILNGTQLPIISGKTSIQGPGASLLTISGNNQSRIIETAASSTVNLSGLTLTQGNDTTNGGGAINHQGALLVVSNSVITGNRTTGAGGGIDADYGVQNLVVENTTITNNFAGSSGGGIDVQGTAVIINSTIAGNSSNAQGGGISIVNIGDILTVTNSTIVGNVAGANQITDSAPGGVEEFGSTTVLNNTIVAGNFSGLQR
ncbi:MAG: hypothetical protein KDA78_18950, partial [Planctomycetaceae bacterium]|nr:hypothetical protein [Planctomycetaceae bacterium]